MGKAKGGDVKGWDWNGALVGSKCSLSMRPQNEAPFMKPQGRCSCCEIPMPLTLRYDPEMVRQRWGRKFGEGLFRFAPLLPGMVTGSCFAGDVGNTPLVQHRLGRDLDVQLFMKLEGGNPSGSFKDRGLAMALGMAWACGVKQVCLPTQGNAGVAAALFSARLGLKPALLYMPASYEGNIYHRSAVHFGARVQFHGDNIAAAGRKMREELAGPLKSGEIREFSTFFEPGRLEGKKTMGLEIAEHFGPELPDWIVYPTGGGTGLVGIWKAFEELRECGLLSSEAKLPRMAAVQAKNCDPVVQAFEANADKVTPVTSRGTLADGLDVPAAIMGHAILDSLRSSRGAAVSVTEEELQAAFAVLRDNGVAAGYEAAATWAGLQQMRSAGTVKAGEKVLLLMTSGHQVPLAK